MALNQQADIVITAQIELMKAQKSFKKILGDSIPRDGTKRMTQLRESLNEVSVAKKTLDRAMGKQAPFQGWALSIMFAGMAVKNALNQIWASSSKTFNEVKHSISGTVTGFDILDGSIKYLGFTVGEALEPLAMLLAPIVEQLAEWVSRNQEWVEFAAVFAGIFGTLATLGGGLVLAKAGFSELLAIMGNIIPSAIAIKTFDWKAIGSSITSGLGTALKLGISLYLIKEAYEDIKGGKWLAAIGDALILAGLALPAPPMIKGALIAVGIAAKLVGDEETRKAFRDLMLDLIARQAAAVKTMEASFNNSLIPMFEKIRLLIAAAIAPMDKKQGILDQYKAISVQKLDWGTEYAEQLKKAQEIADRAKKEADDIFKVKTSTGADIGDVQVQTLFDAYRPIEYEKLRPLIGSLNIDVKEVKGESAESLANRIAMEMMRQLKIQQLKG